MHLYTIAKYGRVTSGPADIHGSVDIRVLFVPARATPKLVLGLAVLFGAVSAYGASSARIARIDDDHRNGGDRGLIRQEQPQLRERPGMQNRTLLVPGLNPLANPVQFFDGDPAPGAFSFGNDVLAVIVVYPSGKAPLLARELLQSLSRGAGLLLQEFLPQSAVPVSDGLQFRSGISPLESKDAFVVSDSSVRAKDWAFSFVAGEALHCLLPPEGAVSKDQIL